MLLYRQDGMAAHHRPMLILPLAAHLQPHGPPQCYLQFPNLILWAHLLRL
jgi:hypothetical protein